MGRMHSKGKGISKSSLPYKRNPPSWLKISSRDVCDQICKLAKKGMRPSQIGVQLRDSQGVTQVKSVTGNKILRILKANGLAPELPEDLYMLIKKAVSVRKHLDRNRKVCTEVRAQSMPFWLVWFQFFKFMFIADISLHVSG